MFFKVEYFLPSFDFWTLCYVWHTRKIIVAKQKNLGREVSKRLFDKTQASGPFFWKLPIFWSDVQHLATQFNLNIWALERPFWLWQKWFKSWVGQLIISFEKIIWGQRKKPLLFGKDKFWLSVWICKPWHCEWRMINWCDDNRTKWTLITSHPKHWHFCHFKATW